ncbi:hypothetical protein JTE90_014260 [Oedothorax gibbosus]|uniref:Uncharacterized protein n=1 Tax=Oedothorax gibbosus TaxID=931172 RepID=A0AAV6UCF9_9ARAC|nr:hypothetical protein JTE90_014260 [Oedothorax gibbosus]
MLKGNKKKKSPWIPPPGRTRHLSKITDKTKSANSTTSMYMTAHDMKGLDDETFDLGSLCSLASSGNSQGDKKVHLRSIKGELKIFHVHFRSLKRMSLFLNKYFITHKIENITLRDLNEKIDESVREIVFELDDLEFSVALVENNMDPQSKSEEYLRLVKTEENLLSKILDCYSKGVTIFEAVIQTHSVEDFNVMQQHQEALQKQLQSSEKKCASQNAMIKDFQRRLSILQGKTSTIESYKSNLEGTRAELQKQLAYKEAQIKYLSTELTKQVSNQHESRDHEELLEIIEKIKKNNQAEKTALKKAVKLQKSRTEDAKEAIEKLTRDLKERDKIMFSLASQRDQLKVQLTLAKNTSIEGKTEKHAMEIQNMKLQKELLANEASYKVQLKEMEDRLKEKTEQLRKAEQDNLNLQKELEKSIKTLEASTNKIKNLNSNADGFLQSQGDGKQNNTLDEVKNLITILKDTKDYFNNMKTNSIYTSAIEDETVPHGNTASDKNILNAVDEVKSHLLDLKNKWDSSAKPSENLELEQKFKDLQQIYEESSKQNEMLKKEIKQLKTSKFHTMPHLRSNESTSTYENDFATRSLQLELKLKTEENWRIKQREKDLEGQLEEVRQKLQREEMENIRLHKIEEDLKVKRNELSLLELKKEEESEKMRRKMGELQESLDKVTTDHTILKRYVEALRTSYVNVFGDSGK